jgi:hypothetical protein
MKHKFSDFYGRRFCDNVDACYMPPHLTLCFKQTLNLYEYSIPNTGQLKKKVTLSHVYNEVTSEPTITRYTTIVRKILKICL